MKTAIRDKKRKAIRRVEELKGFYIHLMVYVLVNTMISVVKVVRNTYNGETISEALFDFGTFAVWFFWGIGVVFHAIKVFRLNPFFSKDWEERQIQKIMEKEREDADKYTKIRK